MDWRSRLRLALSRERIVVWVVVVLVAAAALLVGFAGTPYTAPEGTVDRVQATQDVTVESIAGGYEIRPASQTVDTGLVFYPGARVDPDAYVSVLAPVAHQADAAVFIPRPRLNLAIFEPRMAATVFDANPTIETWYVGGHSLGGAMACRYAASEPEAVDGLVLFGSYCDRSIAETDLAVLTIGGTRDAVLGTSRATLRPENLPESATVRRVEGLNHTYFGSYVGQPDDRPATISRSRAHRILQNEVVNLLRNESG
jgi:hypothetical protein